MEYIFIPFSLIIGGLIGYFYHKSKTSSLIIEKELLKQENENLRNKHQDWESLKEESMSAAKAAMFEASNQLSSKLLEDHKRENNEAKKQAEEITAKTTEDLNKEFKNMVETMAAIQGQVGRHDSKISTVWQALSSPGGAGQYAEIGLENTLKAFGLEKGRDFITQYSVNYEGNRLRPDAIIFLPSDNLVVIDAKSSKKFLEIADANKDDEGKLYAALSKTMNTHLSDLVSRSYNDAIKADAKREPGTIMNVMYLPNEAALQKVFKADPEFRNKCFKKNILLADPSSLQLILSIATHQINNEKQEHNYKIILEEMGKIISSMDVFLRGAEAVGKSIKSSADNYAKLSRSVNGRLISRMKRVLDLGVIPEKDLKLPDALPDYNVIENEAPLIEIQEEEEKVKKLEKKAS